MSFYHEALAVVFEINSRVSDCRPSDRRARAGARAACGFIESRLGSFSKVTPEIEKRLRAEYLDQIDRHGAHELALRHSSAYRFILDRSITDDAWAGIGS